eukprot:jgi/Chrzof1/6334/Cz18g04190.t1
MLLQSNCGSRTRKSLGAKGREGSQLLLRLTPDMLIPPVIGIAAAPDGAAPRVTGVPSTVMPEAPAGAGSAPIVGGFIGVVVVMPNAGLVTPSLP